MACVKFNYSNGRFWYRGSSDRTMEILGIFLATDIGPDGGKIRREYCLTKDNFEIGGNVTYMEKAGDKIIIEDLYATEDDDTCCELSMQQFIYILDAWKELYRLKPKEILITKVNDHFEVKGVN